MSPSGTLVYLEGGVPLLPPGTMMWVDRTGSAQPIAAAGPGSYLGPRLSPDGQKIAVASRRERSRITDVWVYDVERGAPTRVTFDGGAFPIWSPDSKRMAIGTLKLDQRGWQWKRQSALRPATRCSSPRHGRPRRMLSCSCRKRPPEPTGFGSSRCTVSASRTCSSSRASSCGIRICRQTAGGWRTCRTSREPLRCTCSRTRGPAKKFASRLPAEWIRSGAAKGRELLYRSFTSDGQQLFFSAAVSSLAPFRTDPPRLMFQAKVGEYDTTAPERSWDVSADGKRFLLVKAGPLTDKPVTAMHVVLNWAEELTRLAPAK